MRLFTVLVGLVVLLTTLVLLSHGFMDSVAFSALVNMNWTSSTVFHKNPIAMYADTIPQSKVYAIIIDAGSTGTRIHVYKFRFSNDKDVPYVLVDELFEYVKPGLSSYASRVHKLRPGLEWLLQCAKKKVPRPLWGRTAISLKATAGLRLLPEHQANALLQEATAVLQASGFLLGPNDVSVLSGLDEGVFGWVTVNFLLQRVRSHHRSVGTLDLGGGSIQVTFVPDAARHADLREFLYPVQVAGASVSLYSRSYLGLGLMSARHSLLAACRSDPPVPGNSTEIVTDCLPTRYQGHWTFGGVRYLLQSGRRAPDAALGAGDSLFETCYRHSRSLVASVTPVHGAGTSRFFLFSYFYDLVKDAQVALQGNAGLSPDSRTADSENLPGTGISPRDYRALATQVCSRFAGTQRKPFLCLDLVYIYALLKHGFQFPDEAQLQLTKTVNNIELGWALGAVFDLLHRTERV